MAIYKRITDVEVVEKNDNMNVLVEDAGTLKKISAANIGGGTAANENYAILTVYMEKDANYEVSAVETNMTYAELNEAINSHKVILGTLVSYRPDPGDDEWWRPVYRYDNIYSIRPINEGEGNCGGLAVEFGEYFIVYFYSDGTIEGYEGGNG